ncbi:hypothetical protein V8B97DRAFT_1917091 [Scleroderma yunnanense]
MDQPDTKWMHDNLKDLQTVVRNHVLSLKSSYSSHWAQLGETGHGLVMSDREADIMEGLEIANAYDIIKFKFLWYKWMHVLMRTSHIVSCAAMTNSNSIPDLSILDGCLDHDDLSEDSKDHLSLTNFLLMTQMDL